MAKMKGLGRGLDALLMGSDEKEAAESVASQSLPVSSLRPGKYQPRTRMDEHSLTQLAESIKAQGIIQPVVVRQLAPGDYEIIAGERRWRAAQLAGLAEVPVAIRDIPDETALAFALIENIQREDLNPLEEAQGIKRLIDEFGLTHEQAAHAVGRSRSAVSNLLRLLGLAPVVQNMMLEGKLDMGHARALLSLSGGQQVEAAQQIVLKDLSVRQVEKLVQHLLNPPKRSVATEPDRDVVRLAESLSERLGTHVSLKHGKKGAGKLIIEYSNLDMLDELLRHIKPE